MPALILPSEAKLLPLWVQGTLTRGPTVGEVNKNAS